MIIGYKPLHHGNIFVQTDPFGWVLFRLSGVKGVLWPHSKNRHFGSIFNAKLGCLLNCPFGRNYQNILKPVPHCVSKRRLGKTFIVTLINDNETLNLTARSTANPLRV